MKNFSKLLFGIFIFSTTLANAQVQVIEAFAMPTYNLGWKNHGNWLDTLVQIPTFNYNTGVTLTFPMGLKGELETGLHLARKNQDFEYRRMDTEGMYYLHNTLNIKLLYLNLPLLFRYKFVNKPKTRVFLSTGLQYSLTLRATDNYSEILPTNMTPDLPASKDRFRQHGVDLVGGVGISQTIFDNVGVTVMWRNELALNNLLQKDAFGQEPRFLDGEPLYFQDLQLAKHTVTGLYVAFFYRFFE